MMLEVIVAIALAALLITSLALPLNKMIKSERASSKLVDHALLADNFFFDALKDLLTMEAYDRNNLLQEGLTKFYGKAKAEFAVVGFNPMKKRPYYLVTIAFSLNNEPLNSYNVIIKNEALLHPH